MKERAEAVPSAQSADFGYRGLVEQPAEYALRSPTPWMDAPNPGAHRPVGLAAGPTRDAEATYEAEKVAYLNQTAMNRAIINALNIAVPKAYIRITSGNAAGATARYRANADPRVILLALRTQFGTPTPAERQALQAKFTAPWDAATPIEDYFDRLEDCYIASVVARPAFTMEQVTTEALGGIQRTGLFLQDVIAWNAKPAMERTWDSLKEHFTKAFIAREVSGGGTMSSNGYHMAATSIEADDTLANIETSLASTLDSMQHANTASHQNTMSEVNAALAALTARLDAMQLRNTTTTSGTPQPTIPPVHNATIPPPAPIQRQQNARGRGYNTPRTRQRFVLPAPSPTAAPTAVAMTPLTGTRNAPPNPNKWFANWNYCYSCGFDVSKYHTSETCTRRKPGHQAGCTRALYQAYLDAGHNPSRVGQHKTVFPTNPTAAQLE